MMTQSDCDGSIELRNQETFPDLAPLVRPRFEIGDIHVKDHEHMALQ